MTSTPPTSPHPSSPPLANLAPLTFHSLVARPLILKLKRPVRARLRTITDWPVIVIDLHTDEGVVGRAYLEPYVVKAMKYLVAALHDIGEMLAGRPLVPTELYEAARNSLLSVGYEGQSMIAVSGLDMAAWDAHAKAVGLPLCTLLGGSPGTVKAHISNGLWLNSPGATAEEAVELVAEDGFSALKLRLGRERLADDLLTVELVREVVGSEVELLVDFNRSFDLAEAMERCRAIDDLGLGWIEEPLVYDDWDGYAKLTADLRTPVQMGESFYGPRELYKALKYRACDLVMLDFMRIGGVTGCMRSAAIAGAWGVPISTHLYPEVGAHVMRVAETSHWLEWQDWAEPILAEPFKLDWGELLIPDRPGNRLAWDEDAVSYFQRTLDPKRQVNLGSVSGQFEIISPKTALKSPFRSSNIRCSATSAGWHGFSASNLACAFYNPYPHNAGNGPTYPWRDPRPVRSCCWWHRS